MNILQHPVLYITIICALYCCEIRGADTTILITNRNAVYGELGGKGPRYSLNYERILGQRKRVYTLSAGVSKYYRDLSIPVSFTVFNKAKQHHTEFGVGVSLYLQNYNPSVRNAGIPDKQLYITPMIGYRYQQTSGIVLFRAGLSPYLFIDPPTGHLFKFTPSLTIGAYIAAGICF